MSATIESAVRSSAAVVAALLIDNDTSIVEYFSTQLREQNVTVHEATTVERAHSALDSLNEQGIARLVVLLDLMFTDHRVDEGRQLLRHVTRLSAFREGAVSVIVFTGAGDPDTNGELLSEGAAEFYVKGGSPEPVLDEILAYLGRDVLLASSLVEIVDIDLHNREAEVTYRSTESVALSFAVDLQTIPAQCRVAGGSFWSDVYKSFADGRMTYKHVPRPVSEADDLRALIEILGPL